MVNIIEWFWGYRNCHQCGEVGHKRRDMTLVGIPIGFMDNEFVWYHKKCAEEYINGLTGYGIFSASARGVAGLEFSLEPPSAEMPEGPTKKSTTLSDTLTEDAMKRYGDFIKP